MDNCDSNLTEIAVATAAIITALLTLLRNHWEKQAAQRSLFTEFNLRFDKMNESLNHIERVGETDFDYNQILTPQATHYFPKSWCDVTQDYLNLCSEEYLWFDKGLIDEDIWHAWRAGIVKYSKTHCINKVFSREAKHTRSYYGLFESLVAGGWQRLTAEQMLSPQL